MGQLLCKVLLFINRETPWTVFPSLGLSVYLNCQERPHQPTYCIWAVPLMGLSWLFDDHEILFKRELDIFLLVVCLHAMNTERFCLAWTSILLVARARAPTAAGFPSSVRGSHHPCVCCSLGVKSWWLGVDISRLLPLYLNHWKLISSLGYSPWHPLKEAPLSSVIGRS